MKFAIAALQSAQQRSLVPADIEKCPAHAVGTVAYQYGQATDPGEQVVMRMRDLRLQPQKHPGALKHITLLELEHLRIGVNIGMNPENTLGGPVIDQLTEITHTQLALHYCARRAAANCRREAIVSTLACFDLNRGASINPVVQIDDVTIAHAHAANRTGYTHRNTVRGSVNVYIAAHRIDLAQAIEAWLIAAQPEYSSQYPVARGVRERQLLGPDFTGGPSTDKHRIQCGAPANACTNTMRSERCAMTAHLLACAFRSGRDPVTCNFLTGRTVQAEHLIE